MGQPPPYGPPPYQPPPQHPRRSVTKTRGLSDGAHSIHLILTIFTCGAWGLFVWLPWWMFRMIFRRKQVTRYR